MIVLLRSLTTSDVALLKSGEHRSSIDAAATKGPWLALFEEPGRPGISVCRDAGVHLQAGEGGQGDSEKKTAQSRFESLEKPLGGLICDLGTASPSSACKALKWVPAGRCRHLEGR